MQLNQFGQDFDLLGQADQRTFFSSYSEKRLIDLAKPTTFKKAKKVGTAKKKKGKNLKVTSEALEILKNLGLV